MRWEIESVVRLLCSFMIGVIWRAADDQGLQNVAETLTKSTNPFSLSRHSAFRRLSFALHYTASRVPGTTAEPSSSMYRDYEEQMRCHAQRFLNLLTYLPTLPTPEW